ncbi:regulation of nuclear pre-mRNA domain-containing protein 1A-like isoform X1 [Oncorhynchus masou masou]|uniref:regulation of nuclear pre-mRNA domain-containing protein 1A-like isoform X1 n=1 Tax=Oncorhynchus masou masou TaxID=90313 RepID=UPI003183EB0F
MSAFSEAALEKKLSELSNSQQSVQTLSLWLIHHRKHSKTIVNVWFNELKKAKVSRKLTFLYLANDVIQNSKKKGPEFTQDFAPVIVDAFKHVSREGEDPCKKQLGRVLSIWQERAVYENNLLDQLSHVLLGEKKAKKRPYEEIQLDDQDLASQSSPAEPPQTAELIRALQELENAASGDSALRQRISSLPAEVQDTSLLHRITDREQGERLSRLVEEACMLLADFSGRLAAEIDDRRQLTRTLTLFLHSQRDGLAQNEQKLEVNNHLSFFTTHPFLSFSIFIVSVCLACCFIHSLCFCFCSMYFPLVALYHFTLSNGMFCISPMELNKECSK